MGTLIAAPAPAPRHPLPPLPSTPPATMPAPHAREVEAGTAITVHLARRCPCGAGVAIKGVAYAIQAAPRAVCRITSAVEEQVYCAGCGTLGAHTHVAVKQGGAFVRVIDALGKTTKTRRVK